MKIKLSELFQANQSLSNIINQPMEFMLGYRLMRITKKCMSKFKDMEVDVKNWNFSVGKMEKEYIVDLNLKLGIRSKKA